MKVLLVSEYFPPKVFGGGEIGAYALAESLSKNKIEVSILTTHFPDLKKFENRNNLKIYRLLKSGNNPKSPLDNLKRTLHLQKSIETEIKKLHKKHNFDIIHFLNTTSITKVDINVPKVATVNSYSNFCPKGNLFYKEKSVCEGANQSKCADCIENSEYLGKMKNRFYLKKNPLFWIYAYNAFKKRNNALKSVNHFIAISEFIKEHLERNEIKNIDLIPNPILIKDSKEKFPLEKGIKVSFIGTLDKIKGLDFLIDAFNNLDTKATLHIFGDGPEKSRLIKKSKLNIIFHGPVNHKFVPSIYKQSDIIILPTLWPEPLSRTLVEALYFGKPIIATNRGGNKDQVKDNGFLITTNRKELEERLTKLTKDKKLRDKMSKASKKLYKDNFETKKVTKDIIKLYNKLLKQNKTQKDNGKKEI